MNPDRNKSGMTVNALMITSLVASTGIPVVLFALLGFVYATTKPASATPTFGLFILGCAIASLLLVFTI